MTPFYFGTSQRRLFGIYDPARVSGSASLRAAVLCHPWGAEYLHAHRSLRQLAVRLSLAGFHTLRFDYFGTGDSAGDLKDTDLTGWEDDIETAMEELKDLTGAKRVVLAGLRLGATLAASVAAKRPKEVEALILWDPIVSGEAYLQSLGLFREPNLGSGKGPTPRFAEFGRGYEILGFPLTAEMVRQFKAIDLVAQVSKLPVDTLYVVTDRLPDHDTLQRAIKDQQQTSPVIEYFDDLPAWIERPTNAGLVPVNVLNRIVRWLSHPVTILPIITQYLSTSSSNLEFDYITILLI